MRDQFLFSRGQLLEFHLRPFVAKKNRERRAGLFGGLELPGNFRYREREIHAIAAIA